MRRPSLIPALLFAAISVLPGARADLAAASPFLPAGGSSATAQGASGPIELRGVMSTANGLAYCIYDTAKKRDIWVGLNEPGHDFVVRSADPANDSVKVDYQGRSLSLTMRSSKVASSGPATERHDLKYESGLVVFKGGLSSITPSPAEEQKRLDAVAQEVRRRKLEREKAAQQAPQGPGR
jgi:hypothetical protein